MAPLVAGCTTTSAPGSVIDVAAPRGDFYLSNGVGPVVLLSAGVGITPVLAMLHALADCRSDREIWWLHTTRDVDTHAFTQEVGDLITGLPNARQQVFYTSTAGRLDHRSIAALDLPRDATVYMCGPDQFMTDMRSALTDVGIDPAHIHTELFGALPPINPGVVATPSARPHPPAGQRGNGAAGVLLPQRAHGQLVLALWQHPRTRRGLRRPDAVLMPKRGLPHVRHPAHRGNDCAYTQPPLEPPPDGTVLICTAEPWDGIVLDL